jgi:3-hydroxyisobutyrate dehydrogenase-like beta-hydroxyacid dehydrogenase
LHTKVDREIQRTKMPAGDAAVRGPAHLTGRVMTHIALIGFGEAAQAMANGLAGEAGVSAVSAYDIRFADAAQAPDLLARAEARKVKAHAALADALASADIVLSLVVGSAAVKVGEEAGRHLRAGQIFVDLNSISPDAKKRVGEALAAGGPADFVEGAVMARVPPLQHKVPILVAGKAAARAAELMTGCGMVVEAVGDEIGQACAVKMIRSIIVKGVEALLIESLTAAEKAGVRERIVDSISQTFPGIDWRETATYYIGRTQQHGVRRVTEMKEAAATLRSLGLEPVLSTAISETISAAHARFKTSDLPFDREYPEMLAVLAADQDTAGDQAA